MPTQAEQILDTLNCAIVCLDAGLAINYLNSNGEILFGASALSLAGKPFEQLLSPVEANSISDKLSGFAESHQTITEHEAHLTLAGGRSMLIDYSIYPLDAKYESNNILVEIRPLDRQLEIARDVFSSLQNQVSQSFARGIAHEIKNPLGGIRGAAQLLDKELPGSDLKEYTDVIIGEVDRLQVLIDNMLGPGSGLDVQPVNILEVLEHIRRLIETAEPDRVEFQRDYDPSIPEIMADRNLLIQALLNLTLNAVQALGDVGQITFKTRIDRQVTIAKTMHPLVVQIDIIDNGKGIPADMNDTLFLPMVTDKAEGSGLGLPIAQGIISRHGGIIKAESTDAGTTFRTIIPLEQA